MEHKLESAMSEEGRFIEARFIEVTSINVGVFGQTSTKQRAMINVHLIASIESCNHHAEPAVKTMVDMHSSEPRTKRIFLTDTFETVSGLVKKALNPNECTP